MNDALVQSILGFTLETRTILEREADEQLQGIYGWLPDGTFTPANKMPAVTKLPEAAETRARLERFTDDEATAGLDAKAARKKLLRETAFTWLNRFVAFRMMEERRLIRGTIYRLHGSAAYASWFTADGNLEARQLHEAGELPANSMGEGPRHIAYRRFLLWQCAELSRDVSILFDPGTLPSRLCPRPPVLKQLVEAMNAENLVEAWKAGNEEVLGWTYEGFIKQENKDVFKKFSKKKKVLPEEIGAATQRFTPRWIVRYLVENSLGRIWVEMHPDSRLAKSLGYLVPVEKKSTRPVKPVRDIDFLDPSCGSMHFGLVAFDLFVEMYREELERAGQPGWPAKASVAKVEEISSAIVRHNLFGIDLDLRGVQIAALTMLIKARTLQPGCAVTDLNFACANMEQIGGGRLDAIVNQAKFKHPIYERVLRGLVSRMKNSDQLGSLLRPEKVLQELITTERRQAEENLFLLPGLSPDQFKTPGGLEDFFSNLSEQILQQLDVLVQQSRAAGQDPGHLVAEASKGLRFLRLVSRHYDVVATNPPYMNSRNASALMGAHLEDQFKDGKGDLYAAFILRCLELADLGGKVAMVTQQSFMFIGSYEDLRISLRANVAVETMAHLGPRAFPNITGEKVNTTAFVFEKRSTKSDCDIQVGVYFRLIREADSDSKRRAFEDGLASHRCGVSTDLVIHYLQSDFDAMPGKPWVFWSTPGIRRMFSENVLFSEVADWKRGICTGANPRFIRFWWEVGAARLSGPGGKWVPCMKGGPPVKWFGNQFFAINYVQDGKEMLTSTTREGKQSAYVRNPDYYFVEGICYSSVTSKRFSARFMPPGFIFDQASNTVFGTQRGTHEILGVLNSEVAQWILGFNPSVNVVKDDLARIPFPRHPSPAISNAAMNAIELARAIAALKEKEMTFSGLAAERSAFDILDIVSEKQQLLGEIERSIDDEVAGALELSDEDRKLVSDDVALLSEAASSDEEEQDEAEDEDAVGFLSTRIDAAVAWLSYAIGTVLGRFDIGTPGGLGRGAFSADTVAAIRALVDPDGIMPCDDDHPQDISARVVKCLTLMLGEAETGDVIRTGTGESGDSVEALRRWLSRFTGTPEQSYWKNHFQLYRKRPIYWPLQSPRRKYTVWVFHEKFNQNTLFTVRGLVDERLRLLDRQIPDKRREAGNNRSRLKEVDKLMDMADDLREFSRQLQEITNKGYTPHIDDGVLLNAAPLHPLLPSWPETKAAWDELEAGNYDWAQQAMENWPARVKAACVTNKSFAIAHGLA